MRVTAIAAAVLLAAASTARAEVRVVAVGNDVGRDHEPRLRFAEHDADRFATVMRELGRVPATGEVILRGADAATLRGVLLRANLEIRSQDPSSSALVVYYSGHADAEGLHLGNTTLGFDELRTIVESSPARVRVLIVDSCRSGGITQVKGVEPAESFAIRLDNRMEVEGTAIITSSAVSEDSQESVDLKASFFTHHLVSALRGAADRDGDGKVTIGEAYAYAYQETIRSSGQTLKIQHPTYAYDLKGKGDYVLTHLSDGKGRSGTLQIAEAGAYLIFEDQPEGPLAAEIFVGEEGAKLVLPAGKYFVRKRATTSYREYEAVLGRDQTLPLTGLRYREVTYSRLLRKGGGELELVHTLSLMGGARGPLVEGFSPGPQVLLGYQIDLSEISFGAQVRGARSVSTGLRGGAPATSLELGLRLRAERYFDFDHASFALGALAEGAYLRQEFTTSGTAPGRGSWALGFGVLAALETTLAHQLVLRLEGGPLSYAVKRAEMNGGAAVGDKLDTPLTWWVALGTGWRF